MAEKLKNKKWRKIMKTLKSNKGFTLIEIIAVLVILGILAAVAVPRYIDMAEEAKKAAAKGEVAELKSTLNLAFAKVLLQKSGDTSAISASDVVTAANFTSGSADTVGTLPDLWEVKLTASGKVVTIDVSKRGTDEDYVAAGTWNLPI
jgi:prepilin-type N-terminal cleavage/methylation domain-containing protein